MKVIVCGAGEVGVHVASRLAGEGNDVVVIECSAERLQRLNATLDLQTVDGNGARPDSLAAAGAQNADMLIAVTAFDEVNMTACQVAHALFNVPTKIARIRDQRYLDRRWGGLFQDSHIPIDAVISPEREVAAAIARCLRVPGALDTITFDANGLAVIAVRPEADSALHGKPVAELSRYAEAGCRFEVLSVMRGGMSHNVDDAYRVDGRDEVYVATPYDDIPAVMTAFGHHEAVARRIIVVGGGNIGLSLARMLEQDLAHANLKLVEMNSERAKKLAGLLSHFTVIHGDALEPEILNEANVKAGETIVAVTEEDQSNIFACLLAKDYGCQRAIALVNHPMYRGLVDRLGVDIVVQPRAITISKILQHVRRGRILSVHALGENAGEIMEFEALAKSRIIGQALAQMNWPPGVRAGALIRDGEGVLMPRDGAVVKPHDRLILFSPRRSVPDVERVFEARPDFF